MPCSDSARLLRQHLMRQAGWLPPEGLRLWDTWRHRTRRSAAAPTGTRGDSGPLSEQGAEARTCGTRGGSGPLPERGTGSERPDWLEGSGLLEVRLPHVGFQDQPTGVRDLSAGVQARGSRP